ncbi:uncharacterized protein LOC135942726 [Cloeon dipterum]|uniref:uncharacterized protein LOC135942726 n=1 Tax=Cloeon dipterum TaxID=197152 RepID=UPI00321F7A43
MAVECSMSKDDVETLVGLLMEDCNKIVDQLDSLKYLNYKIFADVWKDMRFSMIFWRPTLEMAFENAELVLFVVKNMVLPPNTLSRRLCSMYLLYGVYVKQPGEDYCKFKITLDEWQELNELVQFCVKEELKEHVFIFCKLIQREAFEFCISPIDLTSEKHIELARSKHADLKFPEGLELGKENQLEMLMDSELFLKLANVEKAYNDNKCLDFKGELEPIIDLATHLRKICISKSGKEYEGLRDRQRSANMAALDEQETSLTPISSKTGSKKSPASLTSYSSLPTAGACALLPEVSEKMGRSKKPKGYAISSKTKTPAELKILLPPEGYEYVHSKNSRTLFRKTVPSLENKVTTNKLVLKKKRTSGGSVASVESASTVTQSSVSSPETMSSNQSMPLL